MQEWKKTGVIVFNYVWWIRDRWTPDLRNSWYKKGTRAWVEINTPKELVFGILTVDYYVQIHEKINSFKNVSEHKRESFKVSKMFL